MAHNNKAYELLASVLPVELQHCPVYSSIPNKHLVRDGPDDYRRERGLRYNKIQDVAKDIYSVYSPDTCSVIELELNGHRETLYDVVHARVLPEPQNDLDLLLDAAEANNEPLKEYLRVEVKREGFDTPSMSEIEKEIYANQRHIAIILPASFMEIGAQCRGQIDTTSAYARMALQCLNSFEYMLSKEGLRWCWAGPLKDELLAPSTVTANTEGEAEEATPQEVAAEEEEEGEELDDEGPVTGAKKKKKKKKKKPEQQEKRKKAEEDIPKCIVSALEDYVVVNQHDPKLYGIKGASDDTQMYITFNPNDTFTREIHMPRYRICWEFIPYDNTYNVAAAKSSSMRIVEPWKPDTMSKQEHEGLVEEEQLYNKTYLFDSKAPLGYLVCHFFIYDPRIDLDKGLLRLHINASNMMYNKGNSGLQQDNGLAHATRYALTPIQYMSMVRAFTNIPAHEIRDEIPAYLLFDRNHRFSVFKALDLAPSRPVDSIRGGFDLGAYEEVFRPHGAPEKPVPPELRFEENYVRVVYDNDRVNSAEPRRVRYAYKFRVPNRVIEIEPGWVHPVILNNCMIPFYNRGGFVSTKTLGDSIVVPLEEIHTYNLVCPELKPAVKYSYSEQISELRKCYDAVNLIQNIVHMYDVDRVRLDLQPNPAAEINFDGARLADLDFLPRERANIIRDFMVRSFERPDFTPRLQQSERSVTEHGKMPGPFRKVLDYLQLQRSLNPDFTLFDDLYAEPLAFKMYKDLTLASNYEVNMYQVMDSFFCIHANHKYILLLDKVILRQFNMRFGDQLYFLNVGHSELSKSFIVKVILACVIPGTLEEQSQESKRVVMSGMSRAGEIITKDDVSKENEPGLFQGDGKEQDSDASFKSKLTQGRLFRYVYRPGEYGKANKVDAINTDLRHATWANSNSSIGIVASILTRVKVNILREITPRNISMTTMNQLAGSIASNPEIGRRKKAFIEHYRKRQIFCALCMIFMRAGVIQYNFDIDAHRITGPFLTRFKQILNDVIFKRNVQGITPRTEEGQILPLAEAFMLQRIYAAICSGVFKDTAAKHLYPGAPFSYDLFQELNDLGLLVPIEEDVIKALSYYEDSSSLEYLQEMLDFTKELTLRADAKIALKFEPPQLGVNYDSVSPELYNSKDYFLVDLRAIKAEQGRRHQEALDHNNNIQNGNAYPVAAPEVTTTGASAELRALIQKERELSLIDWGWLNLGKLYGLANNITDEKVMKEKLVDKLLNHINKRSATDKRKLEDLIETLLTTQLKIPDLRYIPSATAVSVGGGVGVLRAYHNEYTSQSPLRFKRISPHAISGGVNSNTTEYVHILVNTVWLMRSLERKESADVTRSFCYPPLTDPPLGPDEKEFRNFEGSSCEQALFGLGYDGANTQRITLPGMTYGHVNLMKGETNAIPGIPQIPKSVWLVDMAERDNTLVDRIKTEVLHHTDKDGNVLNTSHYSTKLIYTEANEAREYQGNGDPALGFTTLQVLNLLREKMQQWGCQLSDGSYTKDPDTIDQIYAELIQKTNYLETFTPYAMEQRFNRIRDEWAQDNQLVDYETTVIESEIKIATEKRNGIFKHPSGNPLESNRILTNLLKRPRGDDVSKEEQSPKRRLPRPGKENLLLD
jgi:hypothetical protein